MEKHIKHFIETKVHILTHERSRVEINDSGETTNAIGTMEFFDVQCVGYYCTVCKKNLDFTEIKKLEEHVLQHLPLREYFVYATNTFRVYAKSEADAMKELSNKHKKVSFEIDTIGLKSELTEEDTCNECGKPLGNPETTERYETEFGDVCKGCYDAQKMYEIRCDECNKELTDREVYKIEELDLCKECYDKSNEPKVPEEGDYIIVEDFNDPNANLFMVYQHTKPIISQFKSSRKKICLEIKAHMEKNKYYPNVWLQLERGGYDQIDLSAETKGDDYECVECGEPLNDDNHFLIKGNIYCNVCYDRILINEPEI